MIAPPKSFRERLLPSTCLRYLVAKRVFGKVEGVEVVDQFKALGCMLKLESPSVRCERDLRREMVNEALRGPTPS